MYGLCGDGVHGAMPVRPLSNLSRPVSANLNNLSSSGIPESFYPGFQLPADRIEDH